MNKYGGRLIYQGRDEMGPLEVIENGYQRSLHFGSLPKQSSMDLNDPQRLCLSYTRAMLSALLFMPSPARVLLIGLGGGSLAKFFLHHFPACHLDAVELRPHVSQIARDYFLLPDSERLHIHHGDAAEFMRRRTPDDERYDLILLDAYTDVGMADSVCGEAFFSACLAQLTESGLLACNLWGNDKSSFKLIIENLRQARMGGKPLLLPVEGKDNVIGLSTADPYSRQALKGLKPLALELQARLDIEFAALLRRLQRSNRWPF